MQELLCTIGKMSSLANQHMKKYWHIKFRKIGILPKLLICIMDTPNFVEMIYFTILFYLVHLLGQIMEKVNERVRLVA